MIGLVWLLCEFHPCTRGAPADHGSYPAKPLSGEDLWGVVFALQMPSPSADKAPRRFPASCMLSRGALGAQPAIFFLVPNRQPASGTAQAHIGAPLGHTATGELDGQKHTDYRPWEPQDSAQRIERTGQPIDASSRRCRGNRRESPP